MSSEGLEAILRPAAILPIASAARIVGALGNHDVSKGGVWNATSSIWQRFDQPWNGATGSHGDAQKIGTIAVVYDQPRRHEITIYKVSISRFGVEEGWTTDLLCDDALKYADLTLETCPRSNMIAPPLMDPFHGEQPLPALDLDLGDVREPNNEPVAVQVEERAKSFFEPVDVGELLRLRVKTLSEARKLSDTA